MVELDKSRPFATVCGAGEKHVYEQDGLKFDAQGNEVGGKPAKVKVEPPKKDVVDTDAKPIETRLLIVDKNANGYLSVKEIKAALTEAGVEFSKKNNSRPSLLKMLKEHMGVN